MLTACPHINSWSVWLSTIMWMHPMSWCHLVSLSPSFSLYVKGVCDVVVLVSLSSPICCCCLGLGQWSRCIAFLS